MLVAAAGEKAGIACGERSGVVAWPFVVDVALAFAAAWASIAIATGTDQMASADGMPTAVAAAPAYCSQPVRSKLAPTQSAYNLEGACSCLESEGYRGSGSVFSDLARPILFN